MNVTQRLRIIQKAKAQAQAYNRADVRGFIGIDPQRRPSLAQAVTEHRDAACR